MAVQQGSSRGQSLLKGASYPQALLQSLFFDSPSPQSPSCWDSALWRLITNLPRELLVSVAQLCLTLCDPVDCSPPGSSVHGFSRQECWSGLPFPSPGGLPDPGIESRSPALQAGSLPTESPGSCFTKRNLSSIPNPQLLTNGSRHCFKPS